MDWNRVEGNWKQVKGTIKEKWGKLTDDNLILTDGRRDQLEGKFQARYGLTRDQVRIVLLVRSDDRPSLVDSVRNGMISNLNRVHHKSASC